MTENIKLCKDLLADFKTSENIFLERTLFNFDCIINNQITKIDFLYDFMNVLFDSLSNAEENLNSEIFTPLQLVFESFQKVQAVGKLKNKQTSFYFNTLKLFNINEPLHSFLLAKILDPNSEHGQDKLFLIGFLKKLGIAFPEQGQWIITAEKGRIDVLLKRQHPHSVVVIENKSNSAGDQPNQLYRYWFREIYYPNRHMSFNYTEEHPEKYQIVYLTSGDWQSPSQNTISKPKDWPLDLPILMPLIPKIWKFNTDICEWLLNIYKGIPEENHRLREYIMQYIEFWN